MEVKAEVKSEAQEKPKSIEKDEPSNNAYNILSHFRQRCQGKVKYFSKKTWEESNWSTWRTGWVQ